MKKKVVLIVAILQILISCSSAQKAIRTVVVESGSFIMGSNDKTFPDENPAHSITVNAFYMSQYEILYDDYWAFCKAAGYPEPSGKFGYPVTNISWEHAVMLCNWLSGRDGFDHAYTIDRDDKKKYFSATCDLTKNGYRLPTEAEWEYAARGGHRSKNSKFSGSNSPYFSAWFVENSPNIDKKPGEMRPNEVGIYDMSGNIEEWCWDIYDEKYYAKSEKINPKGPKSGTSRVVRGGSRRNKMEYIGVTRRQFKAPTERDMYLGFRAVRTKTD